MMYTHRQRLLAVCVCCVIVTTGFSGCATTTSTNNTTFLGGPSFYAITTGPYGNLWFTENLINEIGEISPQTGRITEYNIPTNNAYPIDITTGPDGNLWFTEQMGKKIGKISPKTGIITEYTIPNTVADPIGIVAGPDGNLWFTDEDEIGEISPTIGVITEYDIPTPDANSAAITLGPDDNLWFTEQDKIGEISPKTDDITEYNVPNVMGNLMGITAGPDGNLWFTGQAMNDICKISPTTGNITEYNVPSANADPGGITVGPDGNLWFTETGDNLDPGGKFSPKIGEISPVTGSIIEYAVPDENTFPLGITTGSDGNLWFTENGDNIGKISPTDDKITEYQILGVNSQPHLIQIHATVSKTTPTQNQPSITITYPEGGEIWHVGETVTIKWTSTGLSRSTAIYIDLMWGYGSRFNIISGGGSIPNTGSCEWVIPESIYNNSTVGGNEEIYILDKAANAYEASNPFNITN